MESRPGPSSWMEQGREAGLVLSAQRGDLPALFELLRSYQRPLWRVCFVLTRHRGEAEMLLQETARRAQRQLQQLPVGDPFYPWLVRLARTLAAAQMRRRTPANEARPGAPPTCPDGSAWESGAYGIPYQQRVLAAFAELGPDDQVLIALRLFERLSYADIAATTELPVIAVMHRIAALRERLEQVVAAAEKAA